MLRAVDFLRAVRDGAAVTPEQLRDFVGGITSGEVPDYQASAFLMAVYLNGLSDTLTCALTLAMRDSGAVIDLSDVPGVKVDKHSTGGVGDKISLPLAPLVAACGVPVPMVSGRGLGHTGGTLDKLESIPGFRTDVGLDFFRRTVRDLGICLMGQTADLAPADKKLYALRDVTATVESIPLITASILSKKLAEGINALVLDVKVGRGAFMKDEVAARKLAESLVRVGQGAGLRVRAVLTRMEEPLGNAIGNALEVREAIDILNGCGPPDTTELTLMLAAEMLVVGEVAQDTAAGRVMALQALRSGAAKVKFKAVIAAHGGDAQVVDEPDRLPTAGQQTTVCAARKGYIVGMDGFLMGHAAVRLGAGRARAQDAVDPAVGIVLLRRVGDAVAAGEPVAVVHHNKACAQELYDVQRAVQIAPAAPVPTPYVLACLG